MKTIDFGATIVVYNFIIGVLLMLSSEKIGVYAGHLNSSRSETIARLAQVSVFTFGTCVAILTATIYIGIHTLKIGV